MRILRKLLVTVIALMMGLVATTSFSAQSTHAAPSRVAGDLLSSRDITDAPNTRIAGTRRVIAITYLSENADGKLIPVRATVSVPQKRPGPAGWRILAWGHGTAGLGDLCTVTDRMGTKGHWDPWLGPWLKDGYVIVASEYAGIGGPGVHSYLNGRVAAKNMLDAVTAGRTAIRQFEADRVGNAFVTTGGSQGGQTSLWAGHLAARHAPGLRLVGTSASSVPVHLDEYFRLVRPGVPPVVVPDYVTYFSYVMAGLKVVRPDIDVDSYLTPLGRTVIKNAETLCYPNQGRATKGITVGQLVARPLADGPLLTGLRQLTTLPATGYRAPILLQQGYFDPVAFAPLTDRWVADARRHGARIDYRHYPASHGLNLGAALDTLTWANRLAWPTD